jgi:caa(3)-type oxidase subunit IV
MILCALLVVSVVGPMFEIRVVTLITAFGIAIVKAYLVAANFMHLNIEKRLATYILTTCLVFMFLFFAAVAPDVMKHDGDNWEKPGVKAMVAEGLAQMPEDH